MLHGAWLGGATAGSTLVMARLTPQEFARKWAEATLSEWLSCQHHFLDLYEEILKNLLALNLERSARAG